MTSKTATLTIPSPVAGLLLGLLTSLLAQANGESERANRVLRQTETLLFMLLRTDETILDDLGAVVNALSENVVDATAELVAVHKATTRD